MSQELSTGHMLHAVTRSKHIDTVGAHPGGGERPVWKLLLQGVQCWRSLVLPGEIVGGDGHSDHAFRLVRRALPGEKRAALLARQQQNPWMLARATWEPGQENSHLHFYPELPRGSLESVGVEDKVVPPFTCDRGAIAQRPLREGGPLVSAHVE